MITDGKAVTDTNLHAEKLADERDEQHLLTVPHLLVVHFHLPTELPPLPAVLQKDLGRKTQQRMISMSACELHSAAGPQRLMWSSVHPVGR